MRQTWAIFVDAYRELNSKKLFWVSLSISLAVVIALALPVQTERGLGVFGAKLEQGPFTLLGARAISASAFYKFIYSWFGINLWLGWGATILALISTASMIPDLISSGSIELTLAKPIGRLRLFLTKFVSGLVFVGLQAGVFAVGTILVIGLRSGLWDPRPLLIIPIMVLFFSFLHSISVLVGLITRSTLMSLIAVLLSWMFIWAIGTVENVFFQQVAQHQQTVSRIEDQRKSVESAMATVDAQIERASQRQPSSTPEPPDDPPDPSAPIGAGASGTPPTGAGPGAEPSPRPRDSRRAPNRLLTAGQRILDAATDTNVESLRARKASMTSQMAALNAQAIESNESLATTRKWHGWLYGAFTVLPKTGETKELFQRWVIDKSDWQGFLKMLDEFGGGEGGAAGQEAMNNRPLWWVLGTSLAFEAVLLIVSCVIFCRRDF